MELATIRLRRAEVVLVEDLGGPTLIRRALEFRTGQSVLPLELEDEIAQTFAEMEAPDSADDPSPRRAVRRRGRRDVTAARQDPDPWEEIDLLVKQAVTDAGSEFHSSVLAGELMARIRADRPELWDRWTAVLGLDQLKGAIGRVRRAEHHHRDSALSRRGFTVTEEVDSSHTIRQIGDMIRSDLDYVARSYARRAKSADLRAKRFRALRDRMPDETARVRDVIPETDIAAVYD